mgnify:CR=1 FL=1
MPQITPLGVARQTTLMAQRVSDAVEDALNTIGPESEERITDARLFTKEIELWIEYADKQGWIHVSKHGDAQLVLALGALERLDLYRTF